MTFFSGLTATWFGIAYTLKPMVTMLGVLSVPLVISYPKFKRFFKHPQFMLGITFNYGIWMGYASIYNALDYQILLPMYLGGIWWTMIYDTIYAYQDIDDDKKLGLNSSAIQFQNNPKKAFTALATLSSLWFGISGYMAWLHPIYYAFVGGVAVHYAWQIKSFDINNKLNCRRLFISNQYLGLILTFGIILGKYYQKS